MKEKNSESFWKIGFFLFWVITILWYVFKFVKLLQTFLQISAGMVNFFRVVEYCSFTNRMFVNWFELSWIYEVYSSVTFSICHCHKFWILLKKLSNLEKFIYRITIYETLWLENPYFILQLVKFDICWRTPEY